MFRNPPGEHAARLIEACGLKGYSIGNARISEKHANFIVNPDGKAHAGDIEALIEHARKSGAAAFRHRSRAGSPDHRGGAMSAPGRPKRELPSAEREGVP